MAASNALVIRKEDVIKHVVGAWCLVFDVFDNISEVTEESAAILRDLFGNNCFSAEFSALVFADRDKVYSWLQENQQKLEQIPVRALVYSPDGKCIDAVE